VNPNAENSGEDAARGRLRSDLILLGGIAPLAGLGTGLVGALFRLALEEANRFRDVLMARMDVWGVVGFILFVGLAAGAAAVAAWLVRCIEAYRLTTIPTIRWNCCETLRYGGGTGAKYHIHDDQAKRESSRGQP
jgi:hypothetical protein